MLLSYLVVSYQRAMLVFCSYLDIVENYSENVVDTLRKKNLLLLGEDQYHY